jgi:hypothetical protein
MLWRPATVCYTVVRMEPEWQDVLQLMFVGYRGGKDVTGVF